MKIFFGLLLVSLIFVFSGCSDDKGNGPQVGGLLACDMEISSQVKSIRFCIETIATSDEDILDFQGECVSDIEPEEDYTLKAKAVSSCSRGAAKVCNIEDFSVYIYDNQLARVSCEMLIDEVLNEY